MDKPATSTFPKTRLFTFPVVVGQGTRLFPDSGSDTALELVTSRTTSGGITILTYRPAGRPEYARAWAIRRALRAPHRVTLQNFA